MNDERNGRIAALLSPVFLGLSPFFGKVALVGGADPFTVAALRTGLVALLLWTLYSLFWRKYIYIFPAGLLACIAIGSVNGIGSLFYYSGLERLDASIAQMLNATYLMFVVVLTRIAGAHIGKWTLLRVMIAFLGILFITGGLSGRGTWLGVGLMIGNALLFAGTIIMSQRVLYEMPPQTLTLYVMTSMAVVVIVARLVYHVGWTPLSASTSLALVALALTTAVSRLLLFTGVKGVGGVTTALLSVVENAVAVSLAFIFLDESLTYLQWVGVFAMMLSLFIPVDVRIVEGQYRGMPLPNAAGIRFHQMAFTRAFVDEKKLSTQEREVLEQTLSGNASTQAINTQEMQSLRAMLGDEAWRLLEMNLDSPKKE